VANHSLEVIKAHREQGVFCTLKHFPGHGSSTADSHLGFVDVTDTWSEKELQPYRHIIGAGECDLVMTAHIFNSRLDPNHPATLSYRTITNLLREQLGFWGVVLSDDMQMRAITSHYSLQQALGLSISAGVDMITMSPARAYQPDLASRAIDIIKGFVISGAISESRIEESYIRIKRLKERLGR
jgi:beta-N-acetylhexosaminidase